MPRKNIAGTWDGKPNYRWKKMVKGVTWKLLCRAQKPGEEKENTGWLGLPESDWTEARSQKAANEWWEKWSPLTPEQLAECHDLADRIVKFDRIMSRAGIPKTEATKDAAREIFKALDSVEDTLPTGKGIQYWVDSYLTVKQNEGVSPGRIDNLRRSLNCFADQIGRTNVITDINWQSWDQFAASVLKSDEGDYKKRDLLADSRGFIRHLVARDLIPPIKTLNETKIRVESTELERFSQKELRHMLSESTGMLRCFLLLFYNCGYRQSDVATLTPAMIDGTYITRKRAKNKKKNAPVVSWKLWPETIEAIEKNRSKVGELLLTQEDGKTWVLDSRNDDGTRSRDDAFYSKLWLPFAEKLKLRLPSDLIRRSCANLLHTNSVRSDKLSIQIKYMAQKPSGVALKHYVEPSQRELDSAVMKLRKKLVL